MRPRRRGRSGAGRRRSRPPCPRTGSPSRGRRPSRRSARGAARGRRRRPRASWRTDGQRESRSHAALTLPSGHEGTVRPSTGTTRSRRAPPRWRRRRHTRSARARRPLAQASRAVADPSRHAPRMPRPPLAPPRSPPRGSTTRGEQRRDDAAGAPEVLDRRAQRPVGPALAGRDDRDGSGWGEPGREVGRDGGAVAEAGAEHRAPVPARRWAIVDPFGDGRTSRRGSRAARTLPGESETSPGPAADRPTARVAPRRSASARAESSFHGCGCTGTPRSTATDRVVVKLRTSTTTAIERPRRARSPRRPPPRPDPTRGAPGCPADGGREARGVSPEPFSPVHSKSPLCHLVTAEVREVVPCSPPPVARP